MGRVETVYKDNLLAEAYSYDDNGNRTSENNALRGITRSYTHSVEDHILTAGADSYTFDVDGFLTSRTVGAVTDTFNYSSRGELLSVTLSTGTQITYDHDPLGRRVAKRVDGVITEKYLWQDATTLLAVYDGTDNLIQRFSYADGRMPVSMVYNAATYYLTYDQVGSLRAVTDATGAIVKRVDYDSFGNIISDTNPTFSVAFGFAGGLHDREIGLVRFGARDYDPAIGRWTAKDPIDFAGRDLNLYGYVDIVGKPSIQTNLYLYTSADPVNKVDPLGLWSVSGSLYIPYGGTFSFGRDPLDKKWFLRGSVGVGLAGGISYDSKGGFPKPDDADPCDKRRGFIGSDATIGLTLGPITGEGAWDGGIGITEDPEGKLKTDFINKAYWRGSWIGKRGFGLKAGVYVNILGAGWTW